MTIQKFTTSRQSELTIYENGQITVTNKFGKTYKGRLENGKVVAKSAIGLSYLADAYNEYQGKYTYY